MENKKRILSSLQKELNIHLTYKTSIKDILENYIDNIVYEIPDEFLKDFGIGVAGSHNQFGTVYGFYNPEDVYDLYSIPGTEYYIANDFNAYVNGSNFEDMIIFVEEIPKWIENGKTAITNSNNKSKVIIDKINKL